MKLKLLIIPFLSVMLMVVSVNGQNKAIQISDVATRIVVDAIPETSADWTFESWIYLDQVLGDYTGIIDARASAEPGASALVLRNDAGRQFLGYEWGGQWAFNDGPDIPITEWSHVALVVSSATNMSYMYLNGIQVATDAAYPNLGEEVTLGGDMRIGNSNSMDTRAFLGKMDEVRIWNTARTAEEIAANMNKSVDATSTGLLIQYTCDGTDGDVVLTDATGHYNATITGAVTFVESSVIATSNYELRFERLNLYPTIASDMVSVNGLEAGTRVRIVNMCGQVMASFIATADQLQIPVEAFTPGMYLVDATMMNKVYNARFIKE